MAEIDFSRARWLVRRIAQLLDHPHPGLHTWSVELDQHVQELAQLFGILPGAGG